MYKKIQPGRFALQLNFICWFLIVSQLLRLILLSWQFGDASWNILDLLRTLITGLFFDIGTVTFISIPAILYYTIFPNRWIGSLTDRMLVWLFMSLTIFILVFTFIAELTFWDEFHTRFNFIAVDYLVYTHEVVSNIKQSYPLPLLIGGVLLLTVGVLFLFYRTRAFAKTFSTYASIKMKGIILGLTFVISFFYIALVTNNQAEWSVNRYNSEISKSGIYSFFAAFRNNQMKYPEFYTSIDNPKAFRLVRHKLLQHNGVFKSPGLSVHRTIIDSTTIHPNEKNIVFILVESLSGSFMHEFGNDKNVTPFLDSLAQKSIFFSNLFATGTRTVRGMEAVTLCIPPTPGQSIVKRPNNANLYTVSNVFASRKYISNFFYGGDGYFDNMNAYFGGNGFNIYDRGRGSVLSDNIKTARNNISDTEVTFENAWGICDEDIFNKMIAIANVHDTRKELFFNFVMTTSNHRPYTYPSGKIDIPSGTSRDGAVKYTDFALREMFRKAKTRSWYRNTIFVIIADHCASSAGKDEIDVANYHIPALIVNLPAKMNQKISRQCSQIDLFPTLFSLMGWSYDSDFFGKNVLDPSFEEHALVGTYRKLALIKKDNVMILSDHKKQASYKWHKKDNSLTPVAIDPFFLEETISWYQTADYLFTNELLK